MSRKRKRIVRSMHYDFEYNNHEVSKFINIIMISGKKSLARKITYKSLEYIKNKLRKNPVKVFIAALDNIAPMYEVKNKKNINTSLSNNFEIKTFRRSSLAMRWLKESSRKRSEKKMHLRLAHEILDASEKKGEAIKKREIVHKVSYSDKSYLKHYN